MNLSWHISIIYFTEKYYQISTVVIFLCFQDSLIFFLNILTSFVVTLIALSTWQACKIILKCPFLILQEKIKMPVSKGSILFQRINLFVKARIKQFPVHTLESNQSFTAGLLLPHSGHCSSIIKSIPCREAHESTVPWCTLNDHQLLNEATKMLGFTY